MIPHAGHFLKKQLQERRVNISDFAAHIGVSRRTVSFIINGHRPISTDMALRFAHSLQIPAITWLKLQMEHDLSKSYEENDTKYNFIEPLIKEKSC